MVRLKSANTNADTVYKGFQFHYGSIKIINDVFKDVPELEFQFHYGSIKIDTVFKILYKYWVSIPLWFD